MPLTTAPPPLSGPSIGTCYASRQADYATSIRLNTLQHWQALYREAERQGRLRPNLNDADITHWLSMVRVMFFISYKKMKFDTAKSKRFIRQFVVAAIVTSPD